MIGNKKQRTMNSEQLTIKAFTLVELLVGIAIFSLIAGAIMGILISGIRLQRKALAEQDALNQLSFAMEYMSRGLRMARREDGTFGCLSSGFNYENPAGISTVQFINHLQGDDCQKFFLEGGTLKYTKDVGGANEQTLALTSPDIVIENLSFNLLGESNADSLQPRATVLLKASFPLKIELQTTISQRNLDVQ